MKFSYTVITNWNAGFLTQSNAFIGVVLKLVFQDKTPEKEEVIGIIDSFKLKQFKDAQAYLKELRKTFEHFDVKINAEYRIFTCIDLNYGFEPLFTTDEIKITDFERKRNIIKFIESEQPIVFENFSTDMFFNGISGRIFLLQNNELGLRVDRLNFIKYINSFRLFEFDKNNPGEIADKIYNDFLNKIKKDEINIGICLDVDIDNYNFAFVRGNNISAIPTNIVNIYSILKR